jgi:hypothetical protein
MGVVSGDAAQIPLWIKLGYTVFVGVLVPVYLKHYGPANFLWFSDVALLATALGLWLESSLVVSTMTVAVALPEILWNVDFFACLLTGRAPLGMAAYMFDRRLPRYLRGLSLFHVVLPVVLLWSVARLGYDPRALPAQTISGTLLMILSYTLTAPSQNINWVFGPGSRPQRRLCPLVYVTIVIVSFPVLVYLPTHLLLDKLFPTAR